MTFHTHCFILHVGVTDSIMGWFSGPAAGPVSGAGVVTLLVTGLGEAAGPVSGVVVATLFVTGVWLQGLSPVLE